MRSRALVGALSIYQISLTSCHLKVYTWWQPRLNHLRGTVFSAMPQYTQLCLDLLLGAWFLSLSTLPSFLPVFQSTNISYNYDGSHTRTHQDGSGFVCQTYIGYSLMMSTVTTAQVLNHPQHHTSVMSISSHYYLT